MAAKKWIILGTVVLASALLVVTVVAGPVAQSSEAGPDGAGSASPGGSLGIAAASPVSTSFTYQGQLRDGGGAVNADCDMQFRLYDQAMGGNQVSNSINATVPITEGLFTVSLDFGTVFTGTARWLEVRVQCPGDAGVTTLSPRQVLTPPPYALALPGLWTQQNETSPNLIGGYGDNSVAPGVVGATIGGGGSSGEINQITGDYSTIGGGLSNDASGEHATVGGGRENTASNDYATVGGGWANTASYTYTTVGGGEYNTASNWYATVSGGCSNDASHVFATVGGGWANDASGRSANVSGGDYNTASGEYATVGGGELNTASYTHTTVGGGLANAASHVFATVGGGYANGAGGWAATIGGGFYNTASGERATVGGGDSNTANGQAATVSGGDVNTASGENATVGGGYHNIASGEYATVGGGDSNTAAGDFSFAAGRQAKANNQGCFVWGDSTDAAVTCSENDRAIFRSSGGFYIYTSSVLTSGVYLSAGGSSWNTVSDRQRKENFAPVDTQELLARLAEIPITTWNYKSQDPAVRHIGPMAQDFNTLLDDLGGEGGEYINSLDADGVALAAIQGLYEQNVSLQAKSDALEAENGAQQEQIDALQQQNADLEARVAALETASADGTAPSQVPHTSLLPWVAALLAGAGVAWASRRRDVLGAFNGGGR